MKDDTQRQYDSAKRILDVIAALIALVILAPVFAVLAVLIKMDGGTVFFKQVRVGRHGACFEMLKFRSMIPNAHELQEEIGMKQAENGGYGSDRKFSDPRITKIGSIIRITNLDEIPQLINILIGDMSFVGPRPVPYEESMLYGDYRDKVLQVRPGLSGYWQVKRRMSTTYMQRIQLDCEYVDRRSIGLDLYILFMTPIAMLTSDYNSVSKPLPPFVIMEQKVSVGREAKPAEEQLRAA